MFTGIVKAQGVVKDVERKTGALRFSLPLPEGVNEPVELGASIAIDGVCLTVAEILPKETVTFDVMEETLKKTTLQNLSAGQSVNIERSAKVGDEIGGHFVSGHVFGTGVITKIDTSENNHTVSIQVPGAIGKYIFEKGFVALDGASLTIVDVSASPADTTTFTVWLIPETLRQTTFGWKQVGDLVNVEIDRETQTLVDTAARTKKPFSLVIPSPFLDSDRSSMKNIAIVLGSFHKDMVSEMLEEARKTAKELGVNIIEEVWVPGSVEKPLALKRLLLRPQVHGAVALGIIERGQTKHGLVMGQSVMSAVIDLSLEFMKPIGMGILGPEIDPEQIEPRLLPYARAAVEAAVKMIE
jgi:riboflavin synthase